MSSIIQQIAQHAKQKPQSVALVCRDTTWNYAELVSAIVQRAQVLEQLGLKQGDTILLSAEKDAAFVTSYFACHLLGCVAIPMDKACNEERLQLIINKTKPQLALGLKFTQLRFLSYKELAEISVPTSKQLGDYSLPPASQIADIVFTTGTTGEAKGVLLSHGNLAAAAEQINTFTQIQQSDTELLALPICHSFGLGRMRCVLSTGASLIFTPNFVNTKKIFRLIEQHQVTGFAFVPAAWAYMKKMGAARMASQANSLRYIEIGSAAMPLEDKHELMHLFPQTRICMHYGLTEASRSSFIEFHQDAQYLNTVGTASPQVSILAFSDDGAPLPPNQEGELCIKGKHTCLGYLNDKDTCYYGDYFRSGDWGSIDGMGFIRLASRKKELINTGGKKLAPQEVEVVLLQHPDVTECACVGVADPDGLLGEVVQACLVLKAHSNVPSDEELLSLCREQLEAYKCPRFIKWINQIPKTESGKTQRHLLQ